MASSGPILRAPVSTGFQRLGGSDSFTFSISDALGTYYVRIHPDNGQCEFWKTYYMHTQRNMGLDLPLGYKHELGTVETLRLIDVALDKPNLSASHKAVIREAKNKILSKDEVN